MVTMQSARVRAPELTGRGWLNTGGRDIHLADLRGKIVLLDFWTFCCINCLHVIDELRAIEDKYADVLVVIGVHSPKFEHEKDPVALSAAVERYNVTHPVLDDPELTTWAQYAAKAWPTLAVVDPTGYLVATMAGEGHAEGLERLINQLVAKHDADGTLHRGHGPYVAPAVHHGDLRFPGKAMVTRGWHVPRLVLGRAHDRRTRGGRRDRTAADRHRRARSRRRPARPGAVQRAAGPVRVARTRRRDRRLRHRRRGHRESPASRPEPGATARSVRSPAPATRGDPIPVRARTMPSRSTCPRRGTSRGSTTRSSSPWPASTSSGGSIRSSGPRACTPARPSRRSGTVRWPKCGWPSRPACRPRAVGCGSRTVNHQRSAGSSTARCTPPPVRDSSTSV